jgi:hypothetical protein
MKFDSGYRDGDNETSDRLRAERDAALARAERAESTVGRLESSDSVKAWKRAREESERLRSALATETARREQAERERDDERSPGGAVAHVVTVDYGDAAFVIGVGATSGAAEAMRSEAPPVLPDELISPSEGPRLPAPLTIDGWTYSPTEERYEGPDGVSAYVHGGELTIEREGVGGRSGTDGSIPVAIARALLGETR